MARVPLALAHDYLTQRGGAERVVLAWQQHWPDAPIYTSLFEPVGTYPEFRKADIHTSVLNHSAYLRHHHRSALPFLAPVVSATSIDADVTLASSSGWAHGYRCDGALAVYCHAPARWLYQTDRYFGRGDAPMAASLARRLLFSRLREWDQRAAKRADLYIANSTFTRDLIRDVYGREAIIVAPPVQIPTSRPDVERTNDVVVVARALPYKNLDVVLQIAALTPDLKYRIVGDGPLRDSLMSISSDNVTWCGALDDTALSLEYASSRVHLALSHEDFGITPLEAASFGVPTVARRSGGYLDTIEATNGVLVDEDAFSPAVVASTLRAVLQQSWDHDAMLQHAAKFSAAAHVSKIEASLSSLRG
jgi:glycosyltransferase involved in cell wall biosynthesis